MTLEDSKNIAVIVGAVVGCLSLIKAVYEYTKQTAQTRAEEFFRLDKKFLEDECFEELFNLLEDDDPRLKDVPMATKIRFLGFYENVALMKNSGLMKPHVAHYMFAYYAIRCAESENFWSEINKDSPYWALFTHFTEEMKAIEKDFIFKPHRYKL